jgi:hypothetical protein
MAEGTAEFIAVEPSKIRPTLQDVFHLTIERLRLELLSRGVSVTSRVSKPDLQ